MAVNDERDQGLHKASSLEGDRLTTPSRMGVKNSKRQRDRQGERTLSGKQRTWWKGILMDVIILLVLVGLGTGIFFAYQAIRDIYAPVWDERDIEFVVKIANIDYERADEILPTLADHDLWHTDAADGQRLGTVTDVIMEAFNTGEGKATMTLYLTVSTTAQYHKADGYFVGDIRLLAGETVVYRANGLVSEGMIISITDSTQDAETQTQGGDEAV